MENEISHERPDPEVPRVVAKTTERPISNSSAEQPANLHTAVGVGVAILILLNVGVLYITNSRITDLEARVAALSNSTAKSANPGQAPRPGAGDFAVNMDGAPATGPETAPVTIVEASDFQCPFCAKVKPTLDRVREVYGDNVRIVWKHLPLTSIHPDALAAATASEAAKNQGKFWEYHDKLFANQRKLGADDLRQYAVDLGLDMKKFDADIVNPETRKRVTDDMAEIDALGVTGTPGFFINGKFLNGAQPFESFASAINGELRKLNLPVPQ